MIARKFIVAIVASISALLFVAVPAQAVQAKNVAVSKVNADSAMLVVKADVAANVMVDYGSAPGVYTTTKNSSGMVRHEVLIDALAPYATIYYRVVVSDSANPGNSVTLPERSFKTAKSTGQPFSFGVAGDNRPATNTTVQPAVFGTIMGQMAGENLDLALHVGDIIYGSSTDTLAQNVAKYDGFFAVTAQLTSSVPLYAAIGNHEYINAANSRAGYEQEFTLPTNNGADAASYGEHYYSFDNGDTHFIMLSSEIPGQAGLITGNQKSWLEQDLASTTKTWIVVGFHRVMFSGTHTSDPWINTSNTTGQLNKAELHALFRDYGVDVVFVGHDHFYLHHIEDGVHYVTTGGAGSPLYNIPALGTGDIYASKSYHHVKVDETASQLIVTAINSSGSTLETFTVTPGEPDLSLTLGNIYWASYADYLVRKLSVDYSVANNGSGDAANVQLVYLAASNAVLPLNTVPVAVGRLGNGRSASVTISYTVPAAVSVFVTKAYVTCVDESGTLLSFPVPAPL